MDIDGSRRLFRTLFFIGAMLAFFGIGSYKLDYQSVGIVLMIVGVSMLVLSFSMVRFILAVKMKTRK